jgi:hypothetical protein
MSGPDDRDDDDDDDDLDDDDDDDLDDDDGEETEDPGVSNLADMTPPPESDGVKRRHVAPASFVEAVVRVLEADERARVLTRTVHSATVAFDAGDGRNVSVLIARDKVVVEAVLLSERVYDEEHGVWEDDEHVNDDVHDLACELLERIQKLTGWHVDADYMDFEPDGPCPSCGVEIFEWEDSCGACGASLVHGAEGLAGDGADDDDDADDSPSPRRLAVLAEPDARRRSMWHRARPQPAVAELVGLLLVFPNAHIIQQNDASAVVAIPTQDNPLRVSVHRSAIALDELRPEAADDDDGEDEDAPPSDAVDAMTLAILTAIQQATHWYVDSAYYDGFEPLGACPQCGVEVFVRQERCAECGSAIPETWKPWSVLVAEAIVEALMRDELIELSGEALVIEEEVSALLRDRAHTPRSLLEALTTMDGVDEVFADELAMERIYKHGKAVAAVVLNERR